MRLALSAFLVGMAAFAGCGGGDTGPQRYNISGTVTYKGEPVPRGEVIFYPDIDKGTNGPTAYAKIRDGKFDTRVDKVRGPIAGDLIVQVDAFEERKPNEEFAKRIFESYRTNITMPANDFELKLDVPATKAKK